MSRKYQWCLSGLCALALALALITTSKYGAGVSSDASRNLSTVDSLLAGRGFVDMTGASLVLWPPLYPLVLFALSRLTGLDSFIVAWVLNILLFVINTWLAGWLFYLVFREKTWLAILSSFILALSRSSLSLYANVASEPLFITFLLIFFFAIAKYLQSGSRSALWWIFISSGLATFQRYPGISMFAVGGLIVFYKENWCGLLKAISPVLVSALPFLSWAYFFTYAKTGTFFGPRTYSEMLPFKNMSLSLTKILHWFVPFYDPIMPLLMRPWIIILIVIAILFVINRKANWFAWWNALRSNPYAWPTLIYAVVYFLLMAFTVVTADHLDLTSDRYYVIILPIVLIFLFITLDHLVFSHLDFNKNTVRYTLALIFVVWLIYPVYNLQEYLRKAVVQGEPSNYNIQNSRFFRENNAVKLGAELLKKDPGATMYSNYVNVIWFAYRKPIPPLPFRDAELPNEQRAAYLQQHYSGWPRAKDGYIIWFTRNQYHHIASPNELMKIANLELLYHDKDGEVYRVTAK